MSAQAQAQPPPQPRPEQAKSTPKPNPSNANQAADKPVGQNPAQPVDDQSLASIERALLPKELRSRADRLLAQAATQANQAADKQFGLPLGLPLYVESLASKHVLLPDEEPPDQEQGLGTDPAPAALPKPNQDADEQSERKYAQPLGGSPASIERPSPQEELTSPLSAKPTPETATEGNQAAEEQVGQNRAQPVDDQSLAPNEHASRLKELRARRKLGLKPGPEAATKPRVEEPIDLASTRANLRDHLADLFGDKQSAKRVAQDAGLNIKYINFEGSSVNQWQAIWQEAEKQGKVGALINIAKKEYSNNQAVKELYGTYQAALEQNIRQAQPYQALPIKNTSPTTITVTIDGDFDSFEDAERQRLERYLIGLLSLKGSAIVITKIGRGSVVLSIKLPRNKVHDLYRRLKSGEAEGVKVESIDLSKVNLRALNLSEADLSDAILRMADLRATDLTHANLEGANLDQAIYNEQTRWPEGFDPEKRGAILFESPNRGMDEEASQYPRGRSSRPANVTSENRPSRSVLDPSSDYSGQAQGFDPEERGAILFESPNRGMDEESFPPQNPQGPSSTPTNDPSENRPSRSVLDPSSDYSGQANPALGAGMTTETPSKVWTDKRFWRIILLLAGSVGILWLLYSLLLAVTGLIESLIVQLGMARFSVLFSLVILCILLVAYWWHEIYHR